MFVSEIYTSNPKQIRQARRLPNCAPVHRLCTAWPCHRAVTSFYTASSGQAAAGLTREPSRRATSGYCGQAMAARSPDSLWPAAPCQARCSVRAKVTASAGLSALGADHWRGRRVDEREARSRGRGDGGTRRCWAAAWPAASCAAAHRRGPLPPRGQPRTRPLASPPSRTPMTAPAKSWPGGPPAPGVGSVVKTPSQGRFGGTRACVIWEVVGAKTE